MTNDVNFDALALKSTQTNAIEDLNALFGAVFALPEWHFISRGELPNVYPYVASNAVYADNQPMIRAFTDTQRLIRFARENNLTRPDGSCDTLTIPTGNIVEYLEGFISHGAYGIWFNSDTGSDGFFIPLKQLRPVREHLAKLAPPKADAQKQAVETLQLVITEALMTPSLVSIEAPYKLNYFWRVPSDWVADGQIKKEYFARIDEIVLANDRRSENIPGAQYIIKDIQTKLFTPEMTRAQNWRGMPKEDADNIYYFCLASETGEVKKVTAEEFQADVDASFQPSVKPAGQVREHPQNLNQPSAGVQKPAVETLILQIKDGLGFPSGFVKEADYTCHIFCRVPAGWTEGEQLKAEYLEKIYAQFYGATWRMGNSDGSRYVVLDSYTKIFPPETIKNIQWSGTDNDEKNHYWYYIASADGTIRSVKEEEFGADINTSLQNSAEKSADQPAPSSGSENWGLEESPAGEIDPNDNINQVGAVGFDTALIPFYEAIVPLLRDYKGAGEYLTLLAFDPHGMSGLVEDIAENAHGAYLRIRRFLYLNPKNNVRIGVNSIHSNQLRHVQTNGTLLVSLELCKNLDNQTAVLYYRFEGAKSEVLKLTAAIQPILESVGYRAVQ